MKEIKVHLKERKSNYGIFVQRGLLKKIPLILSSFKKYSRLVVVSDKNVFRHYGKEIKKQIGKINTDAEFFIFPAGETTKSFSRLNELLQFLVEKKCDRSSALLAFGGGVVGDITGFAASAFMRGIDLFQIPTSLMAQVDSSVGGKTGINLPQGKNLVGAFYQPKAVFVDTDLLKTLTRSEYRSALSEVIKYGMIMDKKFFGFLEQNTEDILNNRSSVMEQVVFRCLELKAKVVMKDEKEGGLRAILNLGHTFAHVFETLSDYKGLSHGDAVGAGIGIASRVSFLKGLISKTQLLRINRLLKDFALPDPVPPGNFPQFLKIMGVDKKAVKGKNRFILPKSIGSVIITDEVSHNEIKNAFQLTL